MRANVSSVIYRYNMQKRSQKQKKGATPAGAAVIARPLARKWLRGPAWISGDQVVLDFQRSTSYQPLMERRIWIELTRVRTPPDVVNFVTQYGLLEKSRDCRGLLHPKDIPAQDSEPTSDFIEAGAKLRHIAETMVYVRRAASGDDGAMAWLRDGFGRDEAADDRAVMMEASHSAAWAVNNGLLASGANPYVFDRAQMGESVDPGHWRVGVLPESLRGVCYLMLALSLADREPLEICEQCERLFVVEDPRQRFCTPTCSTRARVARFAKKQSARATKEKHHDKTSRSR